LILAETSFEQVPLLVTSDKHSLDIDEDALLLPLADRQFRATRSRAGTRLAQTINAGVDASTDGG
jgi:hypothetical protein